MTDRYDTSGISEAEFQLGSNDLVLANKLSITDVDEINLVESALLDELTIAVLNEIEANQVLSVADVCEWHRRWLGNVYEWAGRYRSVNMGKGDFHFAAAHLISSLMTKFESQFLQPLACHSDMSDDDLANALANIHIEYILIHPFREGNGRLSRILAMVMATQAGRPLLDFSELDENKTEYFTAVQAGLDNPEPMIDIFKRVLRDTG